MLEFISPGGKLNIKILYKKELDGGGTEFGQDYITVIKERYSNRTFNKCYEWCSGPGFIGFSILDHELCNSLCLSDLYLPAIEYANKTKATCRNDISTYHIDRVSLLPDTEMFDLVVANPPHYASIVSEEDNYNRICTDLDWQAHKEFFNNIKSHLSPNGIILLQENAKGSTVESFSTLIDNTGLKITDSFRSRDYYNENDNRRKIYYIEIQHL